MKVFVTGVNGQLGHDVVNELRKRGYQAFGSDIANCDYPLDITDKYTVEKVLTEIKPDAVVHCAAWTNVDGAEADENKTKVFAINKNGTENIASVCKKLD